MLKGFKEFVSRGNVVDMAVGVVMGSAVTAIVNSIVDNLINPLIAMIFGHPDMSALLCITFNGATISFGAVLSAIINFLLIAIAVYFCIVVPMNKFREMGSDAMSKVLHKDGGKGGDSDDKEEESPKTPDEAQLELLVEIRDLLKEQKGDGSRSIEG
ncbi:MAG: large conductance mechanosensitive channel protein MscL [Bifidobacteriaceae bacterium]|nr:large conductance mechanosensitive channel protein MscL [Bifidobacteriaceae bacterium]